MENTPWASPGRGSGPASVGTDATREDTDSSARCYVGFYILVTDTLVGASSKP